MKDRRNERLRFRFIKRPTSWLFHQNLQISSYPVLLPESQASTLDPVHRFDGWPSELLNRSAHGVTDIRRLNIGTFDDPLYNSVSGLESQRGLVLATSDYYPNLSQAYSVGWQGDSSYTPGSWTYYIPESEILWAIEVLDDQPFDSAFAVVRDDLLATAAVACL